MLDFSTTFFRWTPLMMIEEVKRGKAAMLPSIPANANSKWTAILSFSSFIILKKKLGKIVPEIIYGWDVKPHPLTGKGSFGFDEAWHEACTITLRSL